MPDDYKTLRVPEDDWETAKAQKEEAGRTWGEQIVRPDGDNDTTMDGDVQELIDQLENAIWGDGQQLDRIESKVESVESSASTAEERTGKLERMLEDLR